MSKKESIKSVISKEDIKYMLEKIVQMHHRMCLAKQALAWRNDIEEQEGMDVPDDSPEEIIVDLILEDLDKIFLHIGLDIPEPEDFEARLNRMVPKELKSMEKTDMDKLRTYVEDNGMALFEFIEDGKETPN